MACSKAGRASPGSYALIAVHKCLKGATLEEAGTHDVVPGYIDFVPPWEIHQETNTDQRTIGFIVRSQRSGTFVQNRFNRESGEVDQYDGPVQMAYHLS